jgi:hypothetical protein
MGHGVEISKFEFRNSKLSSGLLPLPFLTGYNLMLNTSEIRTTILVRIFHELLSRDRETGNPLAGLSGAQRARIRWPCHLAPQGVGSEAHLSGKSQGPTPEDARKDGRIHAPPLADS